MPRGEAASSNTSSQPVCACSQLTAHAAASALVLAVRFWTGSRRAASSASPLVTLTGNRRESTTRVVTVAVAVRVVQGKRALAGTA